MVNKNEVIRVHPDFIELLNKFIIDFEKELGIKISLSKATKIIAEKIKNAGGLVI